MNRRRGYLFVFALLLRFHASSAESPYPASPFIAGVTFDWSTHQRAAQGSDNWAITWADDDKQYAVWGDGWGFAESGDKQSLGVSCITGASDGWAGTDLWGLPTIGTAGGKSYGILSVEGVLYMWVGPGSGITSHEEARIYTSTTHGATWAPASWAFAKSQGLVMPTFSNFGQDYEDARDDYVYAYFIRLEGDPPNLDFMIPGMVDLARVPKDSITNQNEWRFFAGLSDGTPLWSTNPDDRQAIFEDPNGVGWNLSVSFNAPLGRYLLCTEHDASFEGRLGIFDAPTPWGPWTTVHYADENDRFGEGYIETNTFYWNFSNKWMSPNGRNFVLVFSGIGENDSFNLVEGSFSAPFVPTPTPPLTPGSFGLTQEESNPPLCK